MSLIGKRIAYEAPLENDKVEKGEGIIIDKFTLPVVSPKTGQVLLYDNYLLEKDDKSVTAINPTLIVKMLD